MLLRRSPRLSAKSPVEKPQVAKSHVEKLTKAEIIKMVTKMICTIDEAASRDAKAAATTKMYEYLATFGLTFVQTHELFRNAVIEKAYALKFDVHMHNNDHPEMVTACNTLLVALGKPLMP